MELANIDHDAFLALHAQLKLASDLCYSLVEPEGRARFTRIMRGNALEICPTMASKHLALNQGGPIDRMAHHKLTSLGEALDLDIQPLVTKAVADAHQPKTMYGEALPPEPEACLTTLERLQAERKAQIQALQMEIEEIDATKHLVTVVASSLHMAKRLESPTTILPHPSTAAKRQKTS